MAHMETTKQCAVGLRTFGCKVWGSGARAPKPLNAKRFRV